MRIILKHLPKDLLSFIEEGKNDFERRSRIIAVKLYLMGVIRKVDLKYAVIIAKRTIGEYNRTIGKKDGTYTEEMYVHGTPFKTAFAYITRNLNHFFTRLKYLVKTYGEENIEIHRMGEGYSADSVVALLKKEHKDVHIVKYVTHEYFESYIFPQEFSSKDKLKKAYQLSKEELEVALTERSFNYKGKTIQIKIIPSSVEPSFEKHKESTQDLIKSLSRTVATVTDLNEKKALEKQIKLQQKELKLYHQLLKYDEYHNQMVSRLKGTNPDELWNEIAFNLKKEYQDQKKAVLKLFNDEQVDLFIRGSRIDYEKFFKITKDITRIENILKDLKQYDYELRRLLYSCEISKLCCSLNRLNILYLWRRYYAKFK